VYTGNGPTNAMDSSGLQKEKADDLAKEIEKLREESQKLLDYRVTLQKTRYHFQEMLNDLEQKRKLTVKDIDIPSLVIGPIPSIARKYVPNEIKIEAMYEALEKLEQKEMRAKNDYRDAVWRAKQMTENIPLVIVGVPPEHVESRVETNLGKDNRKKAMLYEVERICDAKEKEAGLK
jgi:hypothetical protein